MLTDRKKMLLTFSHVSVSGDCTPLSGLLTRASSRKTDEANSFLEVGLSVKLQNGDVVVQRLRVVVVVDVGRGHPEGLRSRAAELLREVVITDADVDGVAGADDAAS